LSSQIKHTIIDNVERAHVRVKASTDNVAGVKLPKFEYMHDGAESKMDMTGLGKGGQQIQGCKASYGQAIELLVELASLQVRTPRCPSLCLAVSPLAAIEGAAEIRTRVDSSPPQKPLGSLAGSMDRDAGGARR
jgi:hypothetical protein